jgi:hypothetical protein
VLPGSRDERTGGVEGCTLYENIQPNLGSTREMRERLREARDYTLTILFGVMVPCLDKVNALITYDIY